MSDALRHARYALAENPVTLAAFGLLVLIVLAALLGPSIAPYDPLTTNTARTLEPPSRAHWFGTDQLGRDILSRVLVATRLDLVIAVGAVGLSFLAGTAAGACAGFFGRWTDRIVSRVTDTIMAFPLFVLAMAIVAALGNNIANVVLATAVINLPFYARMARAEVNVRREAGYVEAARLSGNSALRTLAVHVVPNALPPMMVQVSLNLGWAMLNAAGLSFIGLGVRPPTPEWGILVAEGASFILSGEWWIALFPGLALMLAVFCFNLLGDGLRDIVDPAADVMVTADVPLLSVEDLTVEFRTRDGIVHALEDVSFAVHKGETLGLVGESGSGKSVTALAVMGLLAAAGRVRRGRAVFGGLDLLAAPERQLEEYRGRELSMIFQNPRTALNPIRTVGDQLMDVLVRHANVFRIDARARAVELLRQVQIPDPERRLHAYPFELSGGMCQRVMIALAIACSPALLIADEPTTGIDVTTQAAILDLLRELGAGSRMATVLITHDLGVVAERCDRIVVMHGGHVVETATARDLFAAPRHPYTARLIASTPRPGAKLADLEPIPGSVPDLRRALPPCRYRLRCERARPACDEGPLPHLRVAASHAVACHNPLPLPDPPA